MVQLYIGDGKGKTTASIGQAIRAAGWGGKVLFVQFLKTSQTGEKSIIESLSCIEFKRPIMRHASFIWNMDEKELKETMEDIIQGFNNVKNMVIAGDYSMVVLDEILDCLECGFLSYDYVISLFKEKPEIEYILTGRKASDTILRYADYITEMAKVKHPFDSGIAARRGIEY